MPNGDRATVLVVDDEPDIVDRQATRLESTFRVHRAYGGREALAEFDGAVDVALLGRRMPDLSGDEVLSRFREAGHDCRAVMLIGVGPSPDIAETGFDDYLRRPVDEDALFDCVESLLARRTYDTVLREFYSVARRIALIETEHGAAELADHGAYRRLVERRRELYDRLDDAVDDLREMERFAVAIGEAIPDSEDPGSGPRADSD